MHVHTVSLTLDALPFFVSDAADGALSAGVTSVSAQNTDSPRVSAWPDTATEVGSAQTRSERPSHNTTDQDVVMSTANDRGSSELGHLLDDVHGSRERGDALDGDRGGRDVAHLLDEDDEDVEFPPEEESADVGAAGHSLASTVLRPLHVNTIANGSAAGGPSLSTARSPAATKVGPARSGLVARTSGESTPGRRVERKRRSFHGDDDDDDD